MSTIQAEEVLSSLEDMLGQSKQWPSRELRRHQHRISLAEVRGAITPVAKNGWNPHGKYKFATADDVYAMIRPLLARWNLEPMVRQVEIKPFTSPAGKPHWEVTAECWMRSPDYDEQPVPYTIAVPITGPQTAESWRTYCLKYFLRTRFQIETGDYEAVEMSDQQEEETPVPSVTAEVVNGEFRCNPPVTSATPLEDLRIYAKALMDAIKSLNMDLRHGLMESPGARSLMDALPEKGKLAVKRLLDWQVRITDEGSSIVPQPGSDEWRSELTDSVTRAIVDRIKTGDHGIIDRYDVKSWQQNLSPSQIQEIVKVSSDVRGE